MSLAPCGQPVGRADGPHQRPGAAPIAAVKKGVLVKTVAIKVEDDVHARLLMIAELEGVTLTEVIRQAVEAHVGQLRGGDGLAAKAQSMLDAIDRESQSRKD